MADNVTLNPGIGGAVVAADEIAGAQYQRIKLIHGADGVNGGDVSTINPLPVSGPLTNAEMRATPAPTQLFGLNPQNAAIEEIWKDAFTGSIVQIEIPHAAIHLGIYFSHSGIITIQAGASFDHLIYAPAAPDGKYIHMRHFLFSTTSAPLVHRLYEGPTVVSEGVAQTTRNFSRSHANGTIGMFHNSTVSSTGTLIDTKMISGTKASGGSGETSGTEWNFIRGTYYLSRITNESGMSADVGYTAEWYEL